VTPLAFGFRLVQELLTSLPAWRQQTKPIVIFSNATQRSLIFQFLFCLVHACADRFMRKSKLAAQMHYSSSSSSSSSYYNQFGKILPPSTWLDFQLDQPEFLSINYLCLSHVLHR
jgi:hypothetical protein